MQKNWEKKKKNILGLFKFSDLKKVDKIAKLNGAKGVSDFLQNVFHYFLTFFLVQLKYEHL